MEGLYVEMYVARESRARIMEGKYVSPRIMELVKDIAQKENDKELLDRIAKIK